MSTRYNKIFSLKNNLYTEGSPVVIMAGAIQLDNYKDETFIQLKFKNVSPKKIKSARITLIIGKNFDDEPLVIKHEYKSLDASPDDTFGERALIHLDSKSTKEFSLSSVEVVFEDGETYDSGESVWRAIKQKSIVKLIPEFYQQIAYGERYGKRATKISVGNDNLWLCTCGTPHPSYVHECNVCSAKKEELTGIDTDALRLEGALIVARVRSDGKTLSELREAKEAIDIIPSGIETYDLRNKIYDKYKELTAKKKKQATIAIATSVASLLLIVALLLTVFLFIPMFKYKKANQLYADGKYYEACAMYIETENYKDSQSKMAKALYTANRKANDYCIEGKFIKAYNTIKGFYEDEDVYNYLSYKINYVDFYGSYWYDYLELDCYDDYENWSLWSYLVDWYDLELNTQFYEELLELYELSSSQSPSSPVESDDSPTPPDDSNEPDGENGNADLFEDTIDITGLSSYVISTRNDSAVHLKFAVPYFSTITIVSSSDADLDAILYDEDNNIIARDDSLGDFFIQTEAYYGEILYLEIVTYSTVSGNPATIYISFD